MKDRLLAPNRYLSIRHIEGLAEVGDGRSMGSRGNSYYSALTGTVIGPYRTEVIYRRGSWRGVDAVEYATLEWVDWFSHRGLPGSTGNVPPAKLDLAYRRRQDESAMTA